MKQSIWSLRALVGGAFLAVLLFPAGLQAHRSPRAAYLVTQKGGPLIYVLLDPVAGAIEVASKEAAVGGSGAIEISSSGPAREPFSLSLHPDKACLKVKDKRLKGLESFKGRLSLPSWGLKQARIDWPGGTAFGEPIPESGHGIVHVSQHMSCHKGKFR